MNANYFLKALSVVGTLIFMCGCAKQDETSSAIYSSNEFSVYPDRVIQGKFTSTAVSAVELTSNYESEANQFKNARIDFKFSINARDNEMKSGTDHHFVCLSAGPLETPMIEFGKQFVDTTAVPSNTYLMPYTQLKVKLDMRHVFKAFEEKGVYETSTGEKISKSDFKGVYVAGSVTPLTWDFDNLMGHQDLKLKDDDGDHIYEIDLTLNGKDPSKAIAPHWKLSADLSAFPQYTSSYPLTDALYNLALEEMTKDVEKDSTFRTGKEWSGVWTRDISYSIILAMACLQPEVAKHSLMRKVKNSLIIQDTGTGGAYPASTDRMIWSVAAWEIYKVTGDKKWLADTYAIIKKSAEQDEHNAIDPITGLVKGESSFLDWREQTYPVWMQPADIFESECLGTNAVHHQAHKVLAMMAEILGDKDVQDRELAVADHIREGINNYLWLPAGYYGQFLYGRHYKTLSPKSEALGEALCVLFDVADVDRQKQVIEHTPIGAYGIPCIDPQIPNIPPYHNNAVWPFVQTYWTLACAKAGNENAVVESISAIYRPAALFLTNKENFVSSTGDYASTQINSDNMLWSISGNIATVYKVLFGIQYNADNLTLKPFVPKALAGKRTLSNFRYRQAILNLTMEGYGHSIKSITMDGQPLGDATVPSTLTGAHNINIVLSNEGSEGVTNHVPHHISPDYPVLSISGDTLTWNAIEGAAKYTVIRNGEKIGETVDTKFSVDRKTQADYQVLVVSTDGIESFASEPLIDVPAGGLTLYEVEKVSPKSNLPYHGFSGAGFVETSLSKNTVIKIPVTIASGGLYAVSFVYANGNGPVNTSNKCAIRTLVVDGVNAGTIILPQRGSGEWSDWGQSNSLSLGLTKGQHTIQLEFQSENENMNGDVNQAMLDNLTVIKLR